MQHGRLALLSTSVFLGTAFTLFHLLEPDIDMYFSRTIVPLFFASLVTAQNSTADLKWYAPKKSWINDLGQVVNGTGTYGFEFGGSQLPNGVKYGTYNWCNMPHVRPQEYQKVSEEFELIYVEV